VHQISGAPSPAEGMKNTNMNKTKSFKMQEEEKNNMIALLSLSI